MKREEETEFYRFEKMADRLLSVPHSQIKEKLNTEKKAKRRKKSKTSSASREASDR